DCRDDLAGDAELREGPERDLAVLLEVAHRLEEPDEPLLDQVLGFAAGEEVGAGLQSDERPVPLDERVHRSLVAGPGTATEEPIISRMLNLSLRGKAGRTGLRKARR